jgi:hypothetical protein
MIDNLIACQNDLIAALDARDADAVVAATHALSAALDALSVTDAMVDQELLAHGMKQAEAARIRVKYLTAWNRQKIDRLAELRGQKSAIIYTAHPK